MNARAMTRLLGPTDGWPRFLMTLPGPDEALSFESHIKSSVSSQGSQFDAEGLRFVER